MTGPSGVGEPSFKPDITKVGDQEGGPNQQNLQAALHTKVSTLGQLKHLLESKLGKEDGEKLYSMFMKSFAMIMLAQVQKSAKQAKKSAQGMRMRAQG